MKNCFLFQLNAAYDQVVAPLEHFRKKQIGDVKSGKKKFDKQTAKFCQSQERYLNLAAKKQDSVLQEVNISFHYHIVSFYAKTFTIDSVALQVTSLHKSILLSPYALKKEIAKTHKLIRV